MANFFWVIFSCTLMGCSFQEGKNADRITSTSGQMEGKVKMQSLYFDLSGAESHVDAEEVIASNDGRTFLYQDSEYTYYDMENLCPFTVEVYPEKLHFGDPLYARLIFENSTRVDAYAPFTQSPFIKKKTIQSPSNRVKKVSLGGVLLMMR